MPTPKDFWLWDGLPNFLNPADKDNPTITPLSALQYTHKNAVEASDLAGQATRQIATLTTLVTELGKRVSALQQASDTQAQANAVAITALQEQIKALGEGQVHIEGKVPATLTFGGDQ